MSFRKKTLVCNLFLAILNKVHLFRIIGESMEREVNKTKVRKYALRRSKTVCRLGYNR